MLDTLTGEEKLVRASRKEGWTLFPYRFEGCASLLLRLLPYSDSDDSCRSIPYIPDPIMYHEDSETASSITLEGIELSEPNVLLLDEPTNYISLDVLEAFESAIVRFPGPVMAISHDRWFIQRFGGQVWELSNGQLVKRDNNVLLSGRQELLDL